MNHKQKVKLARRLRTRTEESTGTPLFLSENWLKRKDAIRNRILKQRQRNWERKRIVPVYQ